MSSALKPREPRQKVVLPAKMKAGAAQVDVCIRDISSRGMLIQAGSPPPRGTYVEIVRPGCSIVGRVIWSRQHRFGILSREPISLGSVLDRRTGVRSAPSLVPPLDQRAPRPRPPGLAAAERADRSRAHASLFQFGALIAAGAAGAAVLATTLYSHLTGVFASVLPPP